MLERLFSKRLWATVGFVVLTLLFAALLYLFFFRPPVVPPGIAPGGPAGTLPVAPPGSERPVVRPGAGLPTSSDQRGTPTGGTPAPTAQGDLTETVELVREPTAAPVLGPDGSSLLYYQVDDGRFYRVSPDGAVERLTDEVFFNVSEVTWSPQRNRAVLEYPDGANILYDFDRRQPVTLPQHWEEFSFDPDGDRLAFKSLGVDRESRWLGVAQADGQAAEAIEPLGDRASTVTVSWSPNRQVVGFQRETRGADGQELFFIGLNDENFRSLPVPGVGVRTQWSPDGRTLLFSTSSLASDHKPLLWAAEASGERIGENRRSLNLNTWADKCAFIATTELVCAVPTELPVGSGLAPGVADRIPDNFYRLDLASGASQRLAQPNVPLTASDVMVTTDGQWLLTRDRTSGRLYKIRL